MDTRENELLKEARGKFPKAENDSVAVDNYATEIYNSLKELFGTEEYSEKVKLYSELKALREELINQQYAVV
jgi:protein-arginine kinase activator protein McsA